MKVYYSVVKVYIIHIFVIVLNILLTNNHLQ